MEQNSLGNACFDGFGFLSCQTIEQISCIFLQNIFLCLVPGSARFEFRYPNFKNACVNMLRRWHVVALHWLFVTSNCQILVPRLLVTWRAAGDVKICLVGRSLCPINQSNKKIIQTTRNYNKYRIQYKVRCPSTKMPGTPQFPAIKWNWTVLGGFVT